MNHSLLEIITLPIVTGFAIFSLIHLTIGFQKVKTRFHYLAGLDDTACLLFAFAGIILLLDNGLSIYHAIHSASHDSQLYYKVLGPDSGLFWSKAVSYLIISQLMWYRRFRTLKWLRILTCCVLLLSMERFTINLSYFEHDYGPGTMPYPIKNTLIAWLMRFALFLPILALTQLIVRRASIRSSRLGARH